jgi:CRISPR-associated protein Cmr4
MYKHIKPIFFKAMSGIHAGTGSDLGLVDLPIQRERYSGLPKIESSGVKGCLREEFRENNELTEDFVTIAFGPEDNGNEHGGSIAFTDARLLLFPIRSAKGIFAYATCPFILRRLAEDFKLAQICHKIDLKALAELDVALVSSDKLAISNTKKVVLEEYTIDIKKEPFVEELAHEIAGWLKLDDNEYLKENLIILSDNVFRDFTQNSTEIITRTKINPQKGTVEKGALFTEELLPAETVLYSLVMTSKIFLRKELRENSNTVKAAEKEKIDEGEYLISTIKKYLPSYIQLGGDATIGKGLCYVSMGVGC